MTVRDDELERFSAVGAVPLPAALEQHHVEHDGARIWYSVHGSGVPVVLLHGGLGHGGNWGYQVPALVESGYRAIVVDSRGHGRSTRDALPFSYERMAADVLAVLHSLGIDSAHVVGWSDGAIIALMLAHQTPERVRSVFAFGANMDPSGTHDMTGLPPVVRRCFNRHVKEYAQLSATPDGFKAFADAVTVMMQTQPNYTPAQLREIAVPVAIVHGERDEFIKREHAEYLARTIPSAKPIVLPHVSHFAPLQRPDDFNAAMLEFLGASVRAQRVHHAQ